MGKETYRVIQYLRYRSRAGNAHGLHSPFVYRFYQDVWTDKTPFYIFPIIERERNRLLGSETPIPQVDHGAGSSVSTAGSRTVGDVVRISSSPAWKGQFLFKLANFCASRHMLELGTCLGLATSYLASVSKSARVTTLEGNPHQVKVAQRLFDRLKLKNISLIEGQFKDTLEPLLGNLSLPLDLVFLDGNHQYQPTMDYLNTILPFMGEEGVLVFDDIYWSAEMGRAWKEIVEDERFPVTVDLYHLGIVFLGIKCPKQHFVLK
ncbi:class I SAM-dependent methyltransferase [bacterium SCSIO 12741]|nr:class I SAM-dependent methyltransferase [bacterium SCSIO 12741]